MKATRIRRHLPLLLGFSTVIALLVMLLHDGAAPAGKSAAVKEGALAADAEEQADADLLSEGSAEAAALDLEFLGADDTRGLSRLEFKRRQLERFRETKVYLANRRLALETHGAASAAVEAIVRHLHRVDEEISRTEAEVRSMSAQPQPP